MAQQRNLKQWATIFRALGNPNRLRILKILTDNRQKSVSELAEELDITIKNASRNLGILLNLDLVEFQGKHDRVYYSLNLHLAEDIRKILRVSL